MKRTALPFLLGCLFVVLLSATGVSKSELFTIKPATPKSVICFTRYHGDTERYIKSYVRKGYIFKSSTYGGNNSCIVVMEKY